MFHHAKRRKKEQVDGGHHIDLLIRWPEPNGLRIPLHRSHVNRCISIVQHERSHCCAAHYRLPRFVLLVKAQKPPLITATDSSVDSIRHKRPGRSQQTQTGLFLLSSSFISTLHFSSPFRLLSAPGGIIIRPPDSRSISRPVKQTRAWRMCLVFVARRNLKRRIDLADVRSDLNRSQSAAIGPNCGNTPNRNGGQQFPDWLCLFFFCRSASFSRLFIR